jgi:hypothetical protein
MVINVIMVDECCTFLCALLHVETHWTLKGYLLQPCLVVLYPLFEVC